MKFVDLIQELRTTPEKFEKLELNGRTLTNEQEYTNEDGTTGLQDVPCKLGEMLHHCDELLALLSNTPIKRLVLKNQALSQYAWLNFITRIIEKNSQLSLLSLEKNPIFNDTASNQKFFQSLTRTTSLVELNVKKCAFDNQLLMDLAQALKINKSLKILRIGKSHNFDMDTFDNFVQALGTNTTLLECDIGIRTIHFQRLFSIKRQLQDILTRNRLNNSTMTQNQLNNAPSTLLSAMPLSANVSQVQPQTQIQPPKVDTQTLSTFLKLVVEGEQDQAEVLLQSNIDLPLVSGDVTDLSNRTFNNITGFQYAIWALDWHMWTMIRKYLPNEEASKQLKVMETGAWVTQHGKSASWQNLLDALQEFIDLSTQSQWMNLEIQWQKQVGGAQRLLPVHVVNEYCHPTRPFEPCPDFTTRGLPRSRKMDEGEWFTAVYNGGKLGDKFAYYRYSFSRTWAGIISAAARPADGSGDEVFLSVVGADYKACHALLVTRAQQRDYLFQELVSKNSQAVRKVFG